MTDDQPRTIHENVDALALMLKDAKDEGLTNEDVLQGFHYIHRALDDLASRLDDAKP